MILKLAVLAVMLLISFAGGLGGGIFFSGILEKGGPEGMEDKLPKVEFSDLAPEALKRTAVKLAGWSEDLSKKQNQVLKVDKDLLRRESLLKAERKALDERRKELEALQQDIESSLSQVEENELKNLELLATLYSSMKPKEALDIIRELPEEMIIRLFTRIENKKLVKLIETWGRLFPEEKGRLAEMLNKMGRVVILDNSKKLKKKKEKTEEKKEQI